MDNSSPEMLPKMKEIYKEYEDNPQIIIDYTEVPIFTMRVVFDMVAYVTNKAIFDLGGKEPYIIFMADDVILEPDKVKNVIKIFNSNPNEKVICFWQVELENTRPQAKEFQ